MRHRRNWRRFLFREASKRGVLAHGVYGGTATQGALLTLAMAGANGLNYLFHITMSRMLGPSEYGILSAVNNIFLLIYFGAGVSQVIVSHHTACFEARQEPSNVSSLLAESSKTLVVGGVILTLGFLASSPIAASALRLASPAPLVILATAIVPAIQLPVFRGCLQGLQRFRELAGMVLAQPSLRLLSAIFLVSFGTRGYGAIASITIASLITLGIGYICLSDVFQYGPGPKYRASLIVGFPLCAAVNTVGFAVLTNVDMILVKSFFAPEEAGAYAAAAVLGKVILLLPGAIPAIVFPKLSRQYALGRSSSPTLRNGLLAVAFVSTIPTIVLLLVPEQLVNMFFGPKYERGTPLVGSYGLAMLVYALLSVLIQYYTSVNSKLFSIVVLVSVLLQVGLISFFHQDLGQVISAVAVSGIVALVLGIVFSPLTKLHQGFEG